MPTRLLKLLVNHINTPLSDIFNLSFETSTFPSLLKTSMVIPIFKKGIKTDVSNYRPISLLSNIEKFFEKLVFARISSYLNRNGLIYKNQFGFRQSYSTTHALMSIVERVSRSLDKKMFACGIFVDLKKAFDTVDHDILLKNFLTTA